MTFGLKRAVSVSALLIAAASAGSPCPHAYAQEPQFRVDIPAGPLSSSLSQFSRITGYSVGLPGDMPRVTTTAVSGMMSADAALRRLLQGTGLHAIRVSASVYRIERDPSVHRPEARKGREVSTNRQSDITPPVDIIVTAQKRPQILSSIPLSISVVSSGNVPEGTAAPASRDIAFATEGLAMTNLGPGRNRQFIRGVADSPFSGLSQSTVAVQIDDARVTYDAPDPDLRLFDIDRVEVLKGPQGPLYGSGALGGIYHIVTRRPDLEQASGAVRLTAEAVQHGGVGAGGEAMINMPLADERAAVRGVAYRSSSPGWIDNIGRNDDANSVRTLGARLAVRWRPSDDWTIDIGGMLQNIDARDSQYVLAADNTLKRYSAIAEPDDNDFRLLHGTVEGHVGGLRLLAATSYVDHAVDYTLDASASAPSFGLAGQATFQDDRTYSVLNQEFRLSAGKWLAGASYLQARTHDEATIQGETGLPTDVQIQDRKIIEYAVFSEAGFRLFSVIDATLGARLFHSIAEDERTEQNGQRAQRISKTGLSPSIAFSLPVSESGIFYLRYARALRPGGLAPSGETGTSRFDSDMLGTVDFGIRRSPREGRLSFSASLYYTVWDDIQSDYLLPNGLVSTRNAGRGRILGAEAAAEWKIGRNLDISAGISGQDARLTHAADGLKLDDRRLPIAPDLTGRLAVTKTFDLAQWQARVSAQANYIGKARLTFDDDLDRQMGNYAVVSANGLLTRGGFTFGARIDNLLDVKGDSFAFGNPFSIRAGSQYTPLQPRTLTLSISQSW